MNRRDTFLALLVALVWGTNFLFLRWGLNGIPPLLFAAARFLLVAFPAVLFIRRPNTSWANLFILATLMSTCQFAFLYTALHLGMPTGLASLVVQSQVMMTALIGMGVLGETPTRRQLFGIAVGSLGIALVALGRSSATPLVALLCTLGAACSWACGNVAARKIGTPSGLGMTVWSALFVPLPLLALSWWIEGPATIAGAFEHVTWITIGSTLYTALISSIVGYGIWNTLLAKYPTAHVVPFVLLVPVIGMAIGTVVLHERPAALEWLGGALALTGVAITVGVLKFECFRKPSA